MQPLTTEMILVLCMIGLAVFLFIVEWVRVDVVAIFMMVVLPLLHLVTPKEAFIGLEQQRGGLHHRGHHHRRRSGSQRVHQQAGDAGS
jgi:di/tricarboxylate transporter